MPLIRGMAVSLKKFLKMLEKHGIEHPEERIIRQQLSPHQDAITRSKSYFLRPNVCLRKIDRSAVLSGSTIPLTCVCVSLKLIAQETIDILTDGKGEHIYPKLFELNVHCVHNVISLLKCNPEIVVWSMMWQVSHKH